MAAISFDDLVPSFDDLVPQQPVAPQPGVMAGVSRALESNLPFVDRAVAAAKSALPQGYGGTGQDYAANLTTERAKNSQFAEQNPWTNTVGGITAYAPAALIPGGSGLWGRVGTGALTGFGLGGIQGASNSPDLTNTQETGKSIAQGESEGAALGAGFPAIAHGIGQGYSALADALRGGPSSADLAALGTAKNAAYQNVKDLGAAYSPQSFKSLTDKIASDAAEADIDPDLNPKATKIIANLQNRSAEAVKSGTPVTLTDLDKARQFVNDNLSGLPEPKQARFGSLIKNNIDDFVNTAFPGDMVPMPAKAAAAPTPGVQASIRAMTPQEMASGPTPADVSGAAVSGAVGSREGPQAPAGPAPTPMLDFLRRAGGVKDEGGDLASMGFSNLKGVAAKGSNKIIDKENGLPMDEARRMAVESGYMEPHEDVSDLINKLGEHPTYSVHDEEAVAARAAKDAYDYRPGAAIEGEIFPPAQTPTGRGRDIFGDWEDKGRFDAEKNQIANDAHSLSDKDFQNKWGIPKLKPGTTIEGEQRDPEDFAGLGEEPPAAARPVIVQSSITAAPSAPVASAQEAAAAIRNARDLAQRQFKANALSKALDKAEIRAETTGSYGNIENTTRQRLASLYEKEPWTPDEFAQLKKMAQGTLLTNSLSRASKLSPLGHALPFYADLVGAGLGHATIPGLPSAIGIGAQLGGALARRNAQNELMRTILAGGKTPASTTQSPRLSRAAMAAALAANAQRSQATPQ